MCPMWFGLSLVLYSHITHHLQAYLGLPAFHNSISFTNTFYSNCFLHSLPIMLIHPSAISLNIRKELSVDPHSQITFLSQHCKPFILKNHTNEIFFVFGNHLIIVFLPPLDYEPIKGKNYVILMISILDHIPDKEASH